MNIHFTPLPDDPSSEIDLSEDGVALQFAERHGDTFRYDHHADAWFQWTGKAWRREETQLVLCLTRNLCRELGFMTLKVRPKLSKAGTIRAVESLARTDRLFAVTSEIWDRDPWLLGTPEGTVDLRTGKLRPADPRDYITKSTSVAPADTEDCPKWLEFLKQATKDDKGMIQFLQQWMGYSLTGDTREQSLIFVYGTGGNGKGTFLRAMAGIIGDYAVTAAMETFTAASPDRHPTDLAMLRGARMVSAVETEEGRRWAEARINQLTGEDRISARFMRQDFFTFTPTLKLIVIGNHRPVLRNVTEAAKRRFNIVPFVHKPKKPDGELDDKLKKEWPGILRWIINGCLDWQKNGLVRPDAVTEATKAYFSEQDVLKQWIEDECEPTGFEASKALFKAWTAYALSVGEEPGTQRWLSDNLVRLGYEPERTNVKRGFKGISVKVPPTWQKQHEARQDEADAYRYGEQGSE